MITPGIETGLLTVHVFPRSLETLQLLCQERNMDTSSPHIPVSVVKSGNLIHRKVAILPREKPEGPRTGFVILPILAAAWVGDITYPSTKELKSEVFAFLRKTAFPRHFQAKEMPRMLLEGTTWEDIEVEPLARWPEPEEEETEPPVSGKYTLQGIHIE